MIAPLLALGLTLADMPTALAQQPAPAGQVEGPATPETAQIATGKSRRARRPPIDPATRELRTTRGILAGGIVLTTLCGVGFGLFTAVVVDADRRLSGSAGARTITAGAALLSCTILSIAAIGVAGGRLRAHRRAGRIAWTGGLGLRF